MRLNRYVLETEIEENHHLYYNSYSNGFLFLSKEKHELIANADFQTIESTQQELHKLLIDNQYLVEDDLDEFAVYNEWKRRLRYNSSLYHVMVNTTLDCNLRCWYCYEERKEGSKLTPEVIEAIKKTIQLEYNNTRYNTLKISFFGGEPFLYFKGIKEILTFAKEFSEANKLSLIADFTTNATLITPEIISFLQEYTCFFQITLDGNRSVHNKIKVDANNNERDTYEATLNSLREINNSIPNRYLAVRINFSNATLRNIDEIITDLDFLNRKSSYVILKKVWQITPEIIDKELLFDAIGKLFHKRFLVDYYIMPKGCICFAERDREVLINYDGGVFKCSTISEFSTQNALGKLDLETGSIVWDVKKRTAWLADEPQEICKVCKWYPACLGPCNRQLIAHKDEPICTFDAMNMNEKEYLLYSYKYHKLKRELMEEE